MGTHQKAGTSAISYRNYEEVPFCAKAPNDCVNILETTMATLIRSLKRIVVSEVAQVITFEDILKTHFFIVGITCTDKSYTIILEHVSRGK